MFVPTTFHAALLMTILSTICWGSFANTFKAHQELPLRALLLGLWSRHLPHLSRARLHHGQPRRRSHSAFLANLHRRRQLNLFYAALGGFIFNIANVLLSPASRSSASPSPSPCPSASRWLKASCSATCIQPRRQTLHCSPLGVCMAATSPSSWSVKAYGALAASPAHVSRRRASSVCLISGVLMGSWAPFLAKSFADTAPLHQPRA